MATLKNVQSLESIFPVQFPFCFQLKVPVSAKLYVSCEFLLKQGQVKDEVGNLMLYLHCAGVLEQ